MTQYVASTTKDRLQSSTQELPTVKAPIHLLEKFAFTDINHAYDILKDNPDFRNA